MVELSDMDCHIHANVYCVIYYYSATITQFIYFSLPFFVLIIVLPLIWIYIGVRKGKFTDIHVAIKEQRSEPFIVATVGAILLTLIYITINTPRALIALSVNLVVSGLIFGILSKIWKVSIHAASFTASVIIVALLINLHFIWLLIGLPIIIWARIKRKRHNVSQSLIAAIIIAVTTIIICLLILK